MKLHNASAWLAATLMILTMGMQSACAQPPAEVTRPNRVPLIEKINYTPDTMASSEAQIECLAKDADGDNLTYKWEAEAGKITGTGQNVWWMPPGKMGTYPITLVVSDGKGGAVTENISIRVVTNADGTATPEVELNVKLGTAEPVIVDKQRSRIWMTTDIFCIAEGAVAGNDLTYTWSATGGELQGKGLAEGKADKIRWKAPGVRGDFTVSVTVKDSLGKEAKGQVNINVFCCGN
jgi:hypothetical protein